MQIDFKKELNNEQYLAATSNAKHLRIIAGAGTGKTRTLTFRLAYLLSRGDVKPYQIVAITFTKKAANEMKERTLKLLKEYNINIESYPIILTFHSFCVSFLKKELINHYTIFKPGFTIIDDEDQKNVFKQIAKEFNFDSKDQTFKEYINLIHSLKTKGILPENAVFDKRTLNNPNEFLKIYNRYQIVLANLNSLDFDDILIYTREILTKDTLLRERYSHYYKVFMIDEFQDTNDLQYTIVKLFMNNNTELCVVGDPDQTIYTWRGANNKLIKSKLKEDFPDLETVVLDANYRSTQSILDKANTLISKNHDREKKNLRSFDNRIGRPVEFITAFNDAEEARQIATKIKNFHEDGFKYSDMAIIYRSNFLSRTFERTFIQNKIPYVIYGGVSFFQREEVKNGLAYLKLLVNPDDSLSLHRIINIPKRQIGEVSYNNIVSQAKLTNKEPFRYILENFDSLNLREKIKESLKIFIDAYNETLQNLNNFKDNVSKLVKTIKIYFEKVGLYNYYRQIDTQEENDRTGQKREDNLEALLTDFNDYLENAQLNPTEENSPDLIGFLLNVAVLSSQDALEDIDKVLLMTGHISKGLEFPIVFVTGLVEGIFPSNHTLENPHKDELLEEERRLFYVMMTRAKKYLFVSTFGGKNFNGEPNLPSSLLKDAGFDTKGINNIYNDYANSSSYNRFKNKKYDDIFSTIDLDTPFYYTQKEKKKSDFLNTSTVKNTNLSNTNTDYKVGDQIVHISFGKGKVVSVDNKYIIVDFENGSQKKLAKGFKAFRKVN